MEHENIYHEYHDDRDDRNEVGELDISVALQLFYDNNEEHMDHDELDEDEKVWDTQTLVYSSHDRYDGHIQHEDDMVLHDSDPDMFVWDNNTWMVEVEVGVEDYKWVEVVVEDCMEGELEVDCMGKQVPDSHHIAQHCI